MIKTILIFSNILTKIYINCFQYVNKNIYITNIYSKNFKLYKVYIKTIKPIF